VAAAGLTLVSAQGSLSADSTALAKVGLPLGGGTIKSVSVVTGPHAEPIPVQLRGDRIWPRGRIPAGRHLSIDVVVSRPGWVAWLAGDTERLHLELVTPTAVLRSNYLTLGSGAPLRVQFDQPVGIVTYGPTPAALTRHVLSTPSTHLTLPRPGAAGTIWIWGAPRTWETARPAEVSWFPSGAETAAVASPAPGSTIKPSTPITLTFSKPVSAALGSSRPPVSPITPGTWHQTDSHTIVFHPRSYGYGLGATVTVALPGGVKLVGGHPSGSADVGTWTVPPGSTLRLQQLLASLGYLPLRFNGASVASTPAAQEQAAIQPPQGSFSWRYGNVPSSLGGMWAPGASGEMTKGAVMAFENDQGLTADGVAGPAVWKALLGAAISGHGSTFGYTYVHVSEGSPESINVWHNGKTVVTGPVNTGIPQAPTAQGTFAVFEHSSSVTMSGTNPDGSHYSDPGVPYVSYFNGGDALHGFLRASYGSAQSLGCVEMPYAEAASVYPYTPIGTLVHVD
jgi:peptidoglycan hydrolase-like protein with peptidoglycan-binding domain